MHIAVETITAEPVSVPYLIVRIIARGRETHARVIDVTLSAQGQTGRGQSHPVTRYNETDESVLAQIAAATTALKAGCTREDLLAIMPAGAARNAVDCAFWDLECKLVGCSAESIARLEPVRPVTTVYTLSLRTPVEMAELAAKERDRPLLKIKLGHFADDRARLEGIRKAAPNATLLVDANEGWNPAEFAEMAGVAADCGVALLEQPLHADRDTGVAEISCAVPLCADETCHTRADLDRVMARGYRFINIKLDKTGGLTEALHLAEAAKARGLGIMVGCMSGLTLAMAPGVLIAHHCSFVDLDSPIYLPPEVAPELLYTASKISWAPQRRWGLPTDVNSTLVG